MARMIANVVVADDGRGIEHATIDARLRGGKHRVRFVGDAAQHIGPFPAGAMRTDESDEARRELAIEHAGPALCARECVNTWHALRIEADADDRACRLDGMFAIGGNDDDLAARIPEDGRTQMGSDPISALTANGV